MKKIQMLFATVAMITALIFPTVPAQAITLAEEDILLELEEAVPVEEEVVVAGNVVEEVVELREQELNQGATVPPVDLSTVVSIDTYTTPYFTLEFPFEYEVRYKDGLEITRSYGRGYSLTSIVSPMAIEEMVIPQLSKEGDVLPLLETAQNVTIDGLELKVYDAEGLYTYDCQNNCKIYALNSGEKTFLFIQSTDTPTDWWANHLKWNFDGKTTKSSKELLSDFNDFLHSAFIADTDKEINIAEVGNEIKVTIKVGDKLFNPNKAANTLYNLTNMFTVCKNYAEREYDFTFEFYNTDGTLDGACTFNYSQYSQWNGPNPVVDIEKDLQSSTMELPEKAIGG